MRYLKPLVLLFSVLFTADLQKLSFSDTDRSLNRTSATSDIIVPKESHHFLNWTRLTSINFSRLIRTTRKVAESPSIEVFIAQLNQSEHSSYFIANLFKKIGPIFLTVRNSTVGVDPLAKLVIFVVGDDVNIRNLIGTSGTDSLWTSTNYYIIVTATNPPDLLGLFRDLWNVYFVNNVIFYPTDGSETVSVYNPFKNSTEVTRIFVRNISGLKRSIAKKMNDLNGYPLRVSMFPNRLKAQPVGNGSWVGPDGVILSTLAKRMNFRPITAAPEDGLRYGFKAENGSFTGVLGDLIYDRADISFNSIFIKDYETSKVQFTRPIDFDQLCLIVAKSGLRPHWKGMFLAFSVEMWVALFFTYSFSISFWCFLRKVHCGECSVMLTVLNLYRMFLLFPINKLPKILSERIAVVSFLWFSLSTATIFQASMVKFLSYPSYEPDIKTLQGVADRNFPVMTASENLREAFETEEPVMRRLLENFQLVDKKVDILGKIADERNAAGLGPANDVAEEIATSYVRNNIILLHIVAECPKSYHLAYMLPADSPFLESINKVISIFVESGIIHSWHIRSKPFRPLSDYHQSLETYKPLTMSNVVIAFIIIGFGGGLSVVALVIEVATYRLRGEVGKSSKAHCVMDSKLFRRSRIIYETTRKRFKLLKNA